MPHLRHHDHSFCQTGEVQLNADGREEMSLGQRVRPIAAAEPYFDLGLESSPQVVSTSSSVTGAPEIELGPGLSSASRSARATDAQTARRRPERSIRTTSRDAQTWFNRGLIWCYGFNHEEAIFCFEQALSHDASCAMAWWGLAHALGPNYNKPWDLYDPEEREATLRRAHHAILTAEKYVESSDGHELAMITAMKERYPPPGADIELESCNDKFSQAMGAISARKDDESSDLDIITLHVESLMNLKPWQLWDIKTEEPTDRALVSKIRLALERGFAQYDGTQHPGLLHLAIHFYEMSPTPEVALGYANKLRDIVPDAGHLCHMPTHIDIILGHYGKALASNLAAADADERFFSRRTNATFYRLYWCHDLHFGVYAAMLGGRYGDAWSLALRLKEGLPDELLRVQSPPMADWLESFVSVYVHVLVRFGKWLELLDLPLPEDKVLHCVTTVTIFNGKTIAAAVLGELERANEFRKEFLEAFDRVPETRTLFNNKCTDILAVASSMLLGEIAYRRHAYSEAFSHLRHAVMLDDALPYDEPWAWMQPARHALGALLLEQNQVAEAMNVYETDLGIAGAKKQVPRQMRHPDNIWALRGLHEAYLRLERHEESKELEKLLARAVQLADVEIMNSCFCRNAR